MLQPPTTGLSILVFWRLLTSHLKSFFNCIVGLLADKCDMNKASFIVARLSFFSPLDLEVFISTGKVAPVIVVPSLCEWCKCNCKWLMPFTKKVALCIEECPWERWLVWLRGSSHWSDKKSTEDAHCEEDVFFLSWPFAFERNTDEWMWRLLLIMLLPTPWLKLGFFLNFKIKRSSRSKHTLRGSMERRSSIFEAVDGGLLVSQHFGILQRDMIPERDRDETYSSCRALLPVLVLASFIHKARESNWPPSQSEDDPQGDTFSW